MRRLLAGWPAILGPSWDPPGQNAFAGRGLWPGPLKTGPESGQNDGHLAPDHATRRFFHVRA